MENIIDLNLSLSILLFFIVEGHVTFILVLISSLFKIFFISLSASNIGTLNKAKILATVVLPVPIDPVIPILYITKC